MNKKNEFITLTEIGKWVEGPNGKEIEIIETIEGIYAGPVFTITVQEEEK